MKPKIKTALLQAIKQWEGYRDGELDQNDATCPLCNIGGNCSFCPVATETDSLIEDCADTPYQNWEGYWDGKPEDEEDDFSHLVTTNEERSLAQAEIDFLKSLLPKEDESKSC